MFAELEAHYNIFLLKCFNMSKMLYFLRKSASFIEKELMEKYNLIWIQEWVD